MQRVFRSIKYELTAVEVLLADGTRERILTTGQHPFWVEGQGWTWAEMLLPGQRLTTADGREATVLGVATEAHPEGLVVYNIQVEGGHTYFVDDGLGDIAAIWVHNKKRRGWRQSKPDSKVLRNNLGLTDGDGLAAHHIVAGDIRRAQPARDTLDKYQIDINSKHNGVPLVGGRGAPATVSPRHHRGNGLHSNPGISAVNNRLADAVRGIKNWEQGRRAVLNELATLRRDILAGRFP